MHIRTRSGAVIAYVKYAITTVVLIGINAPIHAQSSDHLPPSKWEAGLTPTVQKLSADLAGEHVWSGGITATVARRINNVFAVEAQLLGAFAPQLNYRNSATLNSMAASLSAEFHMPNPAAWDPYIAAGYGMSSFKYEDAPEGYSDSESWTYFRAAAGVRYALNKNINWRAEFSRQFGDYGGSPTFMTGVSFRFDRRDAR